MGKKQAASAEASARGGALFQPGDEFLSTAKAAELLDRSPKTLEFWRTTRTCPRYYYQGRGIRYLLSDLIRWGMQYPVRARPRSRRLKTMTQPETARRERTIHHA